jgi:hypothetical protein
MRDDAPNHGFKRGDKVKVKFGGIYMFAISQFCDPCGHGDAYDYVPTSEGSEHRIVFESQEGEVMAADHMLYVKLPGIERCIRMLPSEVENVS